MQRAKCLANPASKKHRDALFSQYHCKPKNKKHQTNADDYDGSKNSISFFEDRILRTIWIVINVY